MGLWSNLVGKPVDERVMYMEANEGKQEIPIPVIFVSIAS